MQPLTSTTRSIVLILASLAGACGDDDGHIPELAAGIDASIDAGVLDDAGSDIDDAGPSVDVGPSGDAAIGDAATLDDLPLRTATEEWIERLGGEPMLGDWEREGIAVDPAGNLYVVGTLSSGADFGDGPYSIGEEPEMPSDAMFVASYTAGGAHRWHHVYPAAIGVDCAWSADGDLVVAGFGDLGPGPGTLRHSFVARYSSEGALGDLLEIGREGYQRIRALAIDEDRIYIAGDQSGGVEISGVQIVATESAGSFFIAIDESGIPLWGLAPDEGVFRSIGVDIAVDGDRVALVTMFRYYHAFLGEVFEPRDDSYRHVLTLVDRDGTPEWTQMLERPCWNYRAAVEVRGETIVLLRDRDADLKYEPPRLEARAFDADGTERWETEIEVLELWHADMPAAELDEAGALWIGGTYGGFVRVGDLVTRTAHPTAIDPDPWHAADAFVAKLDLESGEALELFTFGGAGNDMLLDLALPPGRVVVLGRSNGGIGIGPMVGSFARP
jgi:hypothetical protein